MPRFAEINGSNIVLRCVEATQDYIDSGKFGDPERWVLGADEDGGFRYNSPGPGFTFLPDSGEHGAFVCPCPFVGWRLNTEYKWEAPVPKPSTRWEDPEGTLNMYLWDNANIEWKLHRYNLGTGEELIDEV